MSSITAQVRTIRDKLLVLSTLNVMQPMTLEEIEGELAERVKRENVKDILDSLVGGGYVRKITNDYFILSRRGIQAFTRSPLKKSRDIQRMLFLTTNARRGKD